MGVSLGITVSREMLGSGRDPLGLDSAELLNTECPNTHRIVPHGSHPDYGIGRIRVDVDVRGEVHIDAQGTQFTTEDYPLGASSTQIIDCTQRHIPWKFSGWGGNPRDDTAFLIDGDGQWCSR